MKVGHRRAAEVIGVLALLTLRQALANSAAGQRSLDVADAFGQALGASLGVGAIAFVPAAVIWRATEDWARALRAFWATSLIVVAVLSIGQIRELRARYEGGPIASSENGEPVTSPSWFDQNGIGAQTQTGRLRLQDLQDIDQSAGGESPMVLARRPLPPQGFRELIQSVDFVAVAQVAGITIVSGAIVWAVVAETRRRRSLPLQASAGLLNRSMVARDWYIAVGLLVVALASHALVPRYEWREGRRDRRGQEMIRIDRWTGASTVMILWAPPPP